MLFIEINNDYRYKIYSWDKSVNDVTNITLTGKNKFEKKLSALINIENSQIFPVVIENQLNGLWVIDVSKIDSNIKQILINSVQRLTRTFKIIYGNNLLKEQLDKKLKEQENLINALPDILYIIDNKGVIKYIKCDDENALIFNKEAYINNSLLKLHNPKFAQKFIEVINRVIKNKQKEYFEYYLVKNKKVRYYNSVIAPYSRNSAIILERDITEQKELNEKLISEVIATQEKEKNRFAKDMHDGLGQILLAAKMNLTALDTVKEKLDDYENEIYDRTLNLLTKSVQEARNISHGLMSRSLREFGLHFAVNELISNLQSNHLNIEFTSNAQNLRLEQNTEIAIYRIIQEIFNNIIKHSKASQVKLFINYLGNNLYINISDNGRGFDFDYLKKNGKGIGIQNIFTRIQYLNGEIDLQTKPGKGTHYQIKFNINPKKLLSYEKN
jgi:signal transduction histidine kinase